MTENLIVLQINDSSEIFFQDLTEKSSCKPEHFKQYIDFSQILEEDINLKHHRVMSTDMQSVKLGRYKKENNNI